jgi:hypothetical protein
LGRHVDVRGVSRTLRSAHTTIQAACDLRTVPEDRTVAGLRESKQTCVARYEPAEWSGASEIQVNEHQVTS